MHNELLHYGVKGMKWGVRRSIGEKARQYVYADRLYKQSTKYTERLKRKTDLSDKQKTRLKQHTDYQKKLEKAMNKLVKDIKPDDIKQAKVDLVIREVGTLFMGDLVAPTLYGMLLQSSIENQSN